MRIVSLLFILLFLVGCGDTIINSNVEYYDFDIDTNLDEDENGYYHLALTTNGSSNQTLHQFSVDTNHPEDNQYVYWDCDTQYEIILFGQFSEMTDIINHYSYTGDDGIAYTMFGPHSEQCGDTIAVSVSYIDSQYSIFYSDSFEVILDGINGECE